jgi:hypothetical protein
MNSPLTHTDLRKQFEGICAGDSQFHALQGPPLSCHENDRMISLLQCNDHGSEKVGLGSTLLLGVPPR